MIKVSDVYYGKFYIESYQFDYYYKDYSVTKKPLISIELILLLFSQKIGLYFIWNSIGKRLKVKQEFSSLRRI